MNYQGAAERKLLECLQNKKFAHHKWEGSRFNEFKKMSTTEKGDIAEDFFAEMLKDSGWRNVQLLQGRRGDYDVRGALNNTERLFEVKTATKDTSNSFQFNGIRYDTKYTHLFCLGISPEKIGFIIVPKIDLVNGNYKMVSMAKGSNSSFKLRTKADTLLSFDHFHSECAKTING
ncbi:MAG: hypothetical protein GDA40_01490 [Rhodobacteraceae bacterium]|nr:hypothetical protein [Paracoccaceae bacterium]